MIILFGQTTPWIKSIHGAPWFKFPAWIPTNNARNLTSHTLNYTSLEKNSCCVWIGHFSPPFCPSSTKNIWVCVHPDKNCWSLHPGLRNASSTSKSSWERNARHVRHVRCIKTQRLVTIGFLSHRLGVVRYPPVTYVYHISRYFRESHLVAPFFLRGLGATSGPWKQRPQLRA